MRTDLWLKRERVCRESYWGEAPRPGFTALCGQKTATAIPVDEISDAEVDRYQQRCDRYEDLIDLPSVSSYVSVGR